MSELLSKVAEILNAPESLVQRSAEARAEASGKSVDEVLQSWAGGESVAAVEKTVEELTTTDESSIDIQKDDDEEIVQLLIEEELVEAKKESSFALLMGVIGVVVFTYLFAFSIPKQQSEDLVLESLNNSVRVSEEILEGATVYNQLNCQSCHTQNVRVLIPDSQNGKVLKNRFANKNLILNTGLLRLAPDLSTLASREPTNDGDWLKKYLTDPSSVKEEIPHPSINFLNEQDLDYLITYLLSLGSTNE